MTTPTMTQEQATTFDYYSEINAGILEEAAKARGCECQPYIDWFTYERWQAQYKQVQKGETGTKIHIYKSVPSKRDKNADGTPKMIRIPATSSVFCRCQVKDFEPGQEPKLHPKSKLVPEHKPEIPGSVKTLEGWMNRVDEICKAKFEVSVYDLADFSYKDWFESGMKPYAAAMKAKAQNG